jgi:hypothetical protein
VLLLAFLLISPAFAEPGPPAGACSQAKVLEAVQDRLRQAGQPARLEPGSVGQMPGTQPGIVHCAVRVHATVYDTPHHGRVPVETVQNYQYSLELRKNGIFLLP